MSDEFYGFDDEDFDLDDVDEFERDMEIDCHLDRNGFCGKAGSEECEFECPYNNHATIPR